MLKPEEYIEKPFEAAIEYLRNLVPMPSDRWDDVRSEVRDWVFTIAGVTEAQALASFQEIVADAIEQGTLYEDFKEEFSAAWNNSGYGALKQWRLSQILLQNLKNSYGAGRYRQIMDPEIVKRRPWLVYRHDHPIVPRPHHVALDNFVARHDDPVWNVIMPPNGFGCNCKVYSMSDRQLEQAELKPSDPLPYVSVVEGGDRRRVPAVRIDNELVPVTDPGFHYAPGMRKEIPREIMAKLPRSIAQELRQRLALER